VYAPAILNCKKRIYYSSGSATTGKILGFGTAAFGLAESVCSTIAGPVDSFPLMRFLGITGVEGANGFDVVVAFGAAGANGLLPGAKGEAAGFGGSAAGVVGAAGVAGANGDGAGVVGAAGVAGANGDGAGVVGAAGVAGANGDGAGVNGENVGAIGATGGVNNGMVGVGTEVAGGVNGDVAGGAVGTSAGAGITDGLTGGGPGVVVTTGNTVGSSGCSISSRVRLSLTRTVRGAGATGAGGFTCGIVVVSGTVDGLGAATGSGVGNAGGGNVGKSESGTVAGIVIGCGATVLELAPPPPISTILGAVVSLTRTVRVTGSA
jgi:hypothetical protein